jgi:hypothetical protein
MSIRGLRVPPALGLSGKSTQVIPASQPAQLRDPRGFAGLAETFVGDLPGLVAAAGRTRLLNFILNRLDGAHSGKVSYCCQASPREYARESEQFVRL